MARRLTHDEYLNKCGKSLHEFDVIGKYIEKRKKIRIKCKKCGAERDVLPCNFAKGVTCTTCGRLKRRTRDEYRSEFYEINRDSELLSDFNGLFNNVTVKCNKCGNIRDVKASNAIYRKLDCAKCSQRQSIEDVIRCIKECGNDEYEMIDNIYNGDKCNINIRHMKCGLKWNVRLSSFKRGHRCPACNRGSKGELEIIRILNRIDVDYRYEYSVNELKGIGGKSLRYDFAILNNDKVVLFIEFDGRYHFDKDKSRNPRRETILIHDNLKNEYANNKGIKLLRIPYWRYDKMEEIIRKEISEVVLNGFCV